jgi:hypothetical protein
MRFIPVWPVLLCALCVSALSLSSAISVAPPSAQAASNHLHSYLGFDRNDYPGDAAMLLLRKDFSFTGYWLSPPPGEKSNSWRGKHEFLRLHGFGFLPLYLGPDSAQWKDSTSAAKQGTLDAKNASDSASAEGFPNGTIIFLDIEEGGRLTPNYHAYLKALSDEFARRAMKPGVYCSGMPVKESHGVTISTADDIRSDPYTHDFTFWIYNDACPPSPGCAFLQEPPAPSNGGISFASVWQFAQSPHRKQFTARCPAKFAQDGNCYAPSDSSHQWFLDLNSATSADPSTAPQWPEPK